MLGTWLAASAFALQPAVWTRPASLRTRHRCQLVAQDNNWYPAVDEASIDDPVLSRFLTPGMICLAYRTGERRNVLL